MKNNDRIELRKHYKRVVEVISDHWDEPVEYLCNDLSPRGAFLKTNFPLCPGENIVVSFKLPGADEEFDLFGKVVRVDMPKREGDWGEAGMAIDFMGITGKERFLIRQDLRKVPPPLPFKVRLKRHLAKKAA
ncbi:MAG: PilZ domain-containing protein [Pseudomonadota bacterium]